MVGMFGMFGITCCKECNVRKLGCHSTCETYLNEKQRIKEKKDRYYESLPPEINEGDFLGDYAHISKSRFMGIKKSAKRKK